MLTQLSRFKSNVNCGFVRLTLLTGTLLIIVALSYDNNSQSMQHKGGEMRNRHLIFFAISVKTTHV